MKKAEAYAILGLNETASKEEVKKAFKTKAKELHPDINKSTNAEQDFKRANEAYQAIENDNFDDNFGPGVRFDTSPFSNMNWDFINWGHGQQTINFGDIHFSQHIEVEDILLNQTISFKESIIGCKREIKYNCYVMCSKCQGNGEYVVHNGCKDCNGKGKKVNQNKNMFIQQMCPTCRGKVKTEACKDCSEEGKIQTERTISVSIKPGITDGTILRLTGMGNYSGYMIGNSNALITVKVEKADNLELKDNDVITNISISLLQAIRGCTQEVNTIDGKQEIIVPPLSKNKDEVILPNLGVNRTGNEKVIVNIEYPSNIDKLIEVLE